MSGTTNLCSVSQGVQQGLTYLQPILRVQFWEVCDTCKTRIVGSVPKSQLSGLACNPALLGTGSTAEITRMRNDVKCVRSQ